MEENKKEAVVKARRKMVLEGQSFAINVFVEQNDITSSSWPSKSQ